MKIGRPCVNCWPSEFNPSRCENQIQNPLVAAATVQGSLVTDASMIDALDPQPNPSHPQLNDYQSKIDSLTSLVNHLKKMLK